MAGAYCNFCGRRCFVFRVVPGSNITHFATCAEGMMLDRETLGVDASTAVNPVAAIQGSEPAKKHTILTLAARTHAALEAAGLDPENVDLTIHISGNWVSVGITYGEGDFTVQQATGLVKAIGGQPDGPPALPGNAFLHRRTRDGISFTVSHAKPAKKAA